MDGKAKCQPWIQILDEEAIMNENRIRIDFYFTSIVWMNILLHCNFLCSQLNFPLNMKKKYHVIKVGVC
jgi:hypothetical protein